MLVFSIIALAVALYLVQEGLRRTNRWVMWSILLGLPLIPTKYWVPKNLLLFDFVGALATSLSTGLLLTTILPTGLPVWIHCALSITAAGFACVDVVGYCHWPNECWPLTVVGLLNLLYCAAAITALLVFLPQITWIGMIYFAVECAIVIPLAAFELVVARHCRLKSRTINPMDRSCGSAAS